MNAEELIGAARERTGLDRFDSESFRDPLARIIAGIDARPERDQIAAALREEMTQALANRLRVADHLRRHRELLDAPLDVPIVVMGMPRTGTTVLSYLLDCDPRWRSLLNWEAVDSVPPPTTATLRSDPRCAAKKELQEKIFPNLVLVRTAHVAVQQIARILAAGDARLPAERLEVLGLDEDALGRPVGPPPVRHREGGRWALKMPSHSLHFEWALRAFPDARFIWAHRHTVSLGHVDQQFIHDVYPHQIAEHANRPMRLRSDLPEDKVLDVYRAEFLADPVAGMRAIYAWLGENLTPEVEQAMRTWMAKDDERQSDRPGYSIEDFGWTEAELAPHFEEYLASHPRAAEA